MTGLGVGGTVENLVAWRWAAPPGCGLSGIDVGDLASRGEDRRQQGQTVIGVAVDGGLAGLVSRWLTSFATRRVTPCRSSNAKASTWSCSPVTTGRLLTPSRETLGIDDVRAEVLPDAKRDAIAALQRAGRRVAMAGDGDQRRAGAGSGRRRHRHGHRDRHRHGKRRHHARAAATCAASSVPAGFRAPR